MSPGVTAICGAATPSRYPLRLSSILCWPSSVQTRNRGCVALYVKTYCPATANPVIAPELAGPLSTAIHDVIQEPSDEYFSMRPVFGYATNAEPSCATATARGRSSVEGAFFGTFHDFTSRPRPLNFTTREPAGSGTYKFPSSSTLMPSGPEKWRCVAIRIDRRNDPSGKKIKIFPRSTSAM